MEEGLELTSCISQGACGGWEGTGCVCVWFDCASTCPSLDDGAAETQAAHGLRGCAELHEPLRMLPESSHRDTRHGRLCLGKQPFPCRSLFLLISGCGQHGGGASELTVLPGALKNSPGLGFLCPVVHAPLWAPSSGLPSSLQALQVVAPPWAGGGEPVS